MTTFLSEFSFYIGAMVGCAVVGIIAYRMGHVRGTIEGIEWKEDFRVRTTTDKPAYSRRVE